MLKKHVMIILLLITTSCIGRNDQWSCPLRKGKPCKSISEITGVESKKEIIPIIAATEPLLMGDKSSLRKEEKVGILWFAPYVDNQGNKHHESKLSVIIKEPEWR